MFVIVGKTCSGKTTIVEKLCLDYNIPRIVTYTSRLIRKGEIKDITYHYISEEEFLKKIDEGFFAEWKKYETIEGTWYYGTALKDLENAENNEVVILTPDGCRDVEKIFGNDIKCIYIYANNQTIKERLIARGDNELEANRRLSHDNADFKSFEYEADIIIYNNSDTGINKVVKRILEFMEANK